MPHNKRREDLSGPPGNSEDESDSGQKRLLSCSVEETNKLREKLGLAPLRTEESVSSRASQAVDTSAPAKPSAVEVRSRIEESKARRARHQLLNAGADFLSGIADEEQDLDPFAWVAKTRALHRQKKLERQCTQHSQAHDVSLNDDDSDSEHQVGNLRVVHGRDAFSRLRAGEDLVLTLQDRRIINERGELEEDEDGLENDALVEKEQRLKRRKEHLYNPIEDSAVDDLDQELDAAPSENVKTRDVLSHYDEWAATEGGVRAPPRKAAGSFPTLSQLTQAEREPKPSRAAVTLTSSLGVQRDFMTPEELEAYRSRIDAAESKRRKATMQQKRALVNKAMKRKRKLQEPHDVKQEEEQEEPDFISPLLETSKARSNGRFADPVVDDVDVDDALLYAQLSKRRVRPPAGEASSATKPGTAGDDTSRPPNAVNGVKYDGAASAVRETVMHLHKLEQRLKLERSDSGSGLATSGCESVGQVDIKTEDGEERGGGVQFSDITEFCRALETPLEKLESVRASAQTSTTGKSRRGTLADTTVRESARSWREDPGVADGASPMQVEECPENEDGSESSDGEGITDEEKKLVRQILDDDILDGGLISALNYLKSRGELGDECPRRGQRNSENAPLHMSTSPNDVKLEYKDEYGRVMTPKEAFRYISWVFHGKGPGKKKREKLLRKMELEKKIKSFASNHQQLPTMRALRKQQKTGQAHVVLSGTTQ